MSTSRPFAERNYYPDPRRRGKSLAIRATSQLTRRLDVDVELSHLYSQTSQIEKIDPGLSSPTSGMPRVAPRDCIARNRWYWAEQ